MLPTNLTSLEFDDIKSSIKSYLKTRSEFTDYDFEGSALTYLIDTLSYNTYYTAFTANMLVNESFIQSASIRSNIASIAKLLGYTPRSVTASRAEIDMHINTSPDTNGLYPTYVEIQAGPVVYAGGFSFNLLSSVIVPVTSTTGVADAKKLTLYEGTLVTYEYTVDTFQRQRFVLPNENVDTSTLQVYVLPNKSSTARDIYTKAEDPTVLNGTSRIYWLSEGTDYRYEVIFGDGIIGRKLQDGEIIIFKYIVSTGNQANDIVSYSFGGVLKDSEGNQLSSADVDIELVSSSRCGSDRETVESIKYNAPRYYAAQGRAVTATDYETLVKQVYRDTDTATAFGGEKLTPPVWGRVYIALRTTSGVKLNDATKDEIAKKMQKYTVGALETVIIDPDYLYIVIRMFLTYDPNKTSLNASDIYAKAQKAVTDFAAQSGLNNFGGSFSSAKLIRAVSLADPSVEGVSLQNILLKYVETPANTRNIHQVKFGTELLDSGPSNSSLVCDKESILQGGPFITDDRPDVYQYFTDDGKGNLVSYILDSGGKTITNDNFGTVDYSTGALAVGPVNIIGDGNNSPTPVVDGDDTTGLTTVTPGAGAGGGGGGSAAGTGAGAGSGAGGTTTYIVPNVGLSVPVIAIPSNSSTLLPSTPGTLLDIAIPDITIAIVGTTPPPTMPLNNINPGLYITAPSIVDTGAPPSIGNIPVTIIPSNCF